MKKGGVLHFPWLHVWPLGNLSCYLIPLHKWRSSEKWLFAKVWRFLRKTSMMEFFSKVTCLQFTDCNSSIKRLLHRSFSEYVLKASCLKKNILTKKSMVDQCFNKVEPAKPTTLSNNGAHFRPFCRSAVNSNIFTRKPPWWRFLFSRSSVYPCNLI